MSKLFQCVKAAFTNLSFRNRRKDFARIKSNLSSNSCTPEKGSSTMRDKTCQNLFSFP